jgi:MinD-like ATPase involved in chromosome partitioning or flagellar assembly
MARIHMMLQGKGGVGKSVIAATLAQYLESKGQKPLCIDTDPVNATFHGYKALDVQRLQIMEDDEINPRRFDALVDLMARSSDAVVIDNGASSFVPLSHFLISNEVPALLGACAAERSERTTIAIEIP